MEGKKEHYGLVTATTMIIGIVIGSGIFFKCDDVLKYTGGNVWLGVVAFCIGAFSIIFGSLSLTEFSVRTKKNGGIVGYFEDFISEKMACGFGWFQTFIYFPTIIAIVSWVAAIYICTLFDFNATLEMQIIIGFIVMTVFYAVNIVSIKLGGYFQNITTFIKLIPLLTIAVVGMIHGTANPQIPAGVTHVLQSDKGFAWLAALAPIAFSFDGWVVATSITNEVKNAKRNMPIALVIGPCIVLATYLLYFLGLNHMLGAEYIMSVGNDSVNRAGEFIFGSSSTKIILIFVVISIFGVVNGLVLGALRMPQALASKNMIPMAKRVSKMNAKTHLSSWSCLISFAVAVFWLLVHYLIQKNGIMGNGDVSEISIVFSYLCYTLLYVKVMQMRKEKIIGSRFKGTICPIFAFLGSVIILIGGVVSNPIYVPIFILLCSAVCLVGVLYYQAGSKSESDFISIQK